MQFNTGISGLTATFRASLLPADAKSGVTWSNSDARGQFASYLIDAAEGTLTVSAATGKAGTVTLTATANDGSKVKAIVKVQFGKFAQSVTILGAPDELRGGASVTLSTNLAADKTLANKKVVWSLNEEAEPFAAIANNGKLTTKPVSERVTIRVTATSEANGIASDPAEITLCPAVVQPVIFHEGEAQEPNALLRLDTAGANEANPPTLTLTSGMLPDDAMQACTWSVSGRNATIHNGVLTPVWNAKTSTYASGTVTVTCKAADGSNKSAAVKVQIEQFVGSVVLSAPQTEILSKGNVQLTATTSPVALANNRLYWTLKNPADIAYASISGTGKLTAKEVFGRQDVTVVATAKDGGGASGEFTITIKPAPNTILILKQGDINVTKQTLPVDVKAGAVQLSAFSSADGVETPETVTWRSSSAAVAEVNGSGRVTLKKTGSTTITATLTTGGVTRKATVTLKVIGYVETISVQVAARGGVAAVAGGKKLQLKAVVSPQTAANKAVVWSLAEGDEAYATINNKGQVTAVGTLSQRATITVTATAADGKGAVGTLSVSVFPLATAVSILDADGLVLNGRTLTLDNQSAAMQLSALVYPGGENAASQRVTWAPVNANGAAYVDASGMLRLNPQKTGTVTVTAKATDGSNKSASFKVKVVSSVRGIAIEQGETLLTMRGGSKLTLKSVLTPIKPTNAKVIWRLDALDAPYATINAKGQITAKQVTAPHVIHATVRSDENPDIRATATIVILPGVTRVDLWDETGASVAGKTITRSLRNNERTAMLFARAYPLLASQSVTWKSSNPSIATVDSNGVVRAQPDRTGAYKGGKVTITVTAADGSKKSAKVTVIFS